MTIRCAPAGTKTNFFKGLFSGNALPGKGLKMLPACKATLPVPPALGQQQRKRMAPAETTPEAPIILHRKRPNTGPTVPTGEGLPEEGEVEHTPGTDRDYKGRQMRGILKRRLGAWRQLWVSHLVLTWIMTGFPLRWLPGSQAPEPWFGMNHPSTREHEQFVTEAVQELVATATAMEWPQQPKVVCPLGVVTRASNNKLRLIWDGRYVNKHLQIPTFRYESLAQVQEWLEPNDFMCTLDLKAGYHHLDIDQRYWEYLGFCWKGKHYVFTQLPFGLAPACWAFTKLTREVLRSFRMEGTRCSGYIDDSIYIHQSASSLSTMMDRVKARWEDLGFILNTKKGVQHPSQTAQYLGMLIDTVHGHFQVPGDKLDRLRASIKHLMEPGHKHVRQVASVKGQIAAMHWAFGPAAFVFTKQLDAVISSRSAWAAHVVIPAEAIAELQFWLAAMVRFNGLRKLWAPSHVHTVIHTDASGGHEFSFGGWGAWAKLDGKIQLAGGRWTPTTRGASSTEMELRAVRHALTSFNRNGDLDNQAITIRTDSWNVRDAITRGRTHAAPCIAETQQIFLYAIGHNIRLEAVWIPREENQLADKLSKSVEKEDWQLNPAIFSDIANRWGPFQVDLFASHTNHQVPAYYSRFWTPDTAGVNSFAQHWGRACWANPPFGCIPQVFQHARACSARVAIVLPIWPTRPWWNRLFSKDAKFFAPFVRDVYRIPHSADTYLPGGQGNELPWNQASFRSFALLVDFAPAALRTGQVRVPGWLHEATHARLP